MRWLHFVKETKRILLFLGERPLDTDLSIIMIVDIGYSQSCNNKKNKLGIMMWFHAILVNEMRESTNANSNSSFPSIQRVNILMYFMYVYLCHPLKAFIFNIIKLYETCKTLLSLWMIK